MTRLCRIAKRVSAFLEKLEAIQKRLTERGATGEVVSYVSDVLLQQHQRYHESLAAEVDKRKALLDLVKRLEVCSYRFRPRDSFFSNHSM